METEDQNKEQPAEANETAEIQSKLRASAAAVIQRHFSRHPESVMIASIKDGQIQVDASDFPEFSQLLFCGKLIEKHLDEALDNVLIKSGRPRPVVQ